MNVYPFTARKPSALYVVDVLHEEGMWIAVCDALSVATEAESFEALMARFWEIAPEIAAENGMAFDPATVRVDFVHATGGAMPDLRTG